MLRSVLCVLLALAPLRASAEVYVCQETAVGGLKWEGQSWHTTTYKGDTFTLSRLPADAPEIVFCGELKADDTQTLNGEKYRSYGACYKFAVLGQSHWMMGCNVLETNDTITRVMCDGVNGHITLVPNGEMIRTSHFGAPLSEIP